MRNDKFLSDFLSDMFSGIGMNDMYIEAETERIYRAMVGSTISKLTPSVKYSSGTLVLTVSAAALRHELTSRRESLLRHLNKSLVEVLPNSVYKDSDKSPIKKIVIR